MISVEIEDIYLDIYLPKNSESNQPLNLLYVLDGDAFGSIVADTVRLQMRNSPKTGVIPMIVVAISYHKDQSFVTRERFLDFTYPEKNVRLDDKRKDMPTGGNIKDFQRKIKLAQAYMEENYTINPEKIGMFGHSLGGLCVLESYLDQSLSFLTDYLAVSPSLWWDQEIFFTRLNQAIIKNKQRVALSVGALEGDMVELAERADKELRRVNLVKEMSLYKAMDENHMSVVMTTLSRNLRWFCQ